MKNLTTRLLITIAITALCACGKPDEKNDPVTPPDKRPENPTPTPSTPDKWLSEVLEFMPAPGQYTNSSTSDLKAAQMLACTQEDDKIVPGKGMVSLGGFGGYIVFRFSRDVENGEGPDFVILGNAFANSSEPGIVQVAFDANGNGKHDPDEEWYELAAPNRKEEVEHEHYELTYHRPDNLTQISDIRWSDNMGGSGIISTSPIASSHNQCIYPLAEYFADGNVPESITFQGVKLKNNGTTTNGTYWYLPPIGPGYADNYSSDYQSIINNDSDTRNSNKFDIDDAIDKNGNPVKLSKITFIRVYNPMHQWCGMLGETSPEICGAINLR